MTQRALAALSNRDIEAFSRVTRTLRCLGRLEVGDYVIQEEEVAGRGPESERHLAVYRIASALIAEERLLR